MGCGDEQMTTLDLARRAQRLYPANPTYRAAWLRMIKLLGNRWLLATPINRTKGTV